MSLLNPPADRRADLLVVGLAFFSFIVLGMPAALLGVVWSPYMRETLQLPLDAVGVLTVTTTVAYFVASIFSGRLMSRLPVGILMALSAAAGALGLLGYVVAPSWLVMLIAGVVVGAGGGVIDAGMNIYFAARFGPRLMNWLHACFGIGSTLAPVVMSIIFNLGGIWRWGYLVGAILYGLLILLFFVTRGRWGRLDSDSSATKSGGASAAATLRLPLVWLGVGLFVAYAGLEASAGQWSFSLFYEARGVAETTARDWVSFYWGSFTIGRIVFGAIVNRFTPAALIRFCGAGVIVGGLLLWWMPVPEAGLLGLSLYGFMLAPIFALLITSTQNQLGPQHAPNAIGFQVGAASLGFGLLPGLAGVLATRFGLEAIGPFLLVLAVAMVLLYEVSVRFRPLAPAAAPVPVADNP